MPNDDALVIRYEKAKDEIKRIEDQRQASRVKRDQLDTFLDMVLQQDSVLPEFDETLWYAVQDKVTVYASDNIQVTFRDGTVVKS